MEVDRNKNILSSGAVPNEIPSKIIKEDKQSTINNPQQPNPKPPTSPSIRVKDYEVNLSQVEKNQIPNRVLDSELTQNGTIKTHINLPSRDKGLKNKTISPKTYHPEDANKNFQSFTSGYPLDEEPKKYEFEMGLIQNINGNNSKVEIKEDSNGCYAKVKQGAKLSFNFQSSADLNNSSSLDLIKDNQENVFISANVPAVNVHIDETPTMIFYNPEDNSSYEGHYTLEEAQEIIEGIYLAEDSEKGENSEVHIAPLIIQSQSEIKDEKQSNFINPYIYLNLGYTRNPLEIIGIASRGANMRTLGGAPTNNTKIQIGEAYKSHANITEAMDSIFHGRLAPIRIIATD